jgi:hypothetical protein
MGGRRPSALVERYDHFGEHTRLWIYRRLLTERGLVRRFGLTGIPRIQKLLLPFVFPLVQRKVAVRRYRDTPAGRFVLRLYQQDRPTRVFRP